MTIIRMKGLSSDVVEVETRAINLVHEQAEQLVQKYRKRFGGGVSTDQARELFPDYPASLENRLRYAASRTAIRAEASFTETLSN